MLSRDERERSNNKSSSGRSSPYHPRKPESRGSRQNSFQSSKDERRAEDGRSVDRSPHHYPILDAPSPTLPNSSPKIPSGPRGMNGKPPPPNHDRPPRIDSRPESEIDQMRPPAIKPLANKVPTMNSPIKNPNEFNAQNSNSKECSSSGTSKEAVVALLGIFAKQVTECTSLAFERDKAKKNLETQQENYEKTKIHHAAYETMRVHQVGGVETWRAKHESSEARLAKKEADTRETMESLATRIVSGGVDTSSIIQDSQKMQNQINELVKRFEVQSEELIIAKQTISSLNQAMQNERQYFSNQVAAVQGELVSIKNTATNDQAIRMRLETQASTTSNLASRLDSDMINLREELGNTRRNFYQDMDPLRNLGQQIGQAEKDIKVAMDDIKQVQEDNKIKEQDLKRRDSQWDQDQKQLQAHENFHKKLTETQQQTSEQLKSLRNDTTDLRKKVTVLEQATAKLQKVDKKPLNEEVVALRERIDSVESKTLVPQPNVLTKGRPNIARGAANSVDIKKLEELFSIVEGMKDEFEQLQANITERFETFTSDSDDILCGKIDEVASKAADSSIKVSSFETNLEALATEVSALSTNFEGLKQRHSQDTQGLGVNIQNLTTSHAAQWDQQGRVLQELQKEVRALKVIPRPPEIPSNLGQNPTALARQASSPIVSNVLAHPTALARQASSPIVSNVLIQGRQPGNSVANAPVCAHSHDVLLISNKTDALEMSILHLNSRFNNLTTEALGRQMWSQLDLVHPHLKDATRGLPALHHSLQTHDGQLTRLQERVDVLEKKPVFPPGLKEGLEKFDQSVTTLGNRAEVAEKAIQSLEEQIDNVRTDLAKKEVAPTPLNQSNGVARLDRSSSDSNPGKRKATDNTNGNSSTKRIKLKSRPIINDSEDDEQDS